MGRLDGKRENRLRAIIIRCPTCWRFKFYSITAYNPYMRDVLHWIPISQRIQYCITAMIYRCVLGCAPLTFATSAAQCQLWQRDGCCVLLRGVSVWSLG